MPTPLWGVRAGGVQATQLEDEGTALDLTGPGAGLGGCQAVLEGSLPSM